MFRQPLAAVAAAEPLRPRLQTWLCRGCTERRQLSRLRQTLKAAGRCGDLRQRLPAVQSSLRCAGRVVKAFPEGAITVALSPSAGELRRASRSVRTHTPLRQRGRPPALAALMCLNFDSCPAPSYARVPMRHCRTCLTSPFPITDITGWQPILLRSAALSSPCFRNWRADRSFQTGLGWTCFAALCSSSSARLITGVTCRRRKSGTCGGSWEPSAGTPSAESWPMTGRLRARRAARIVQQILP
jgi:hypothetical protein